MTARPSFDTTPESGWVEWAGGECPVPAGTVIEIKLDDGTTHKVLDPTSDLIAWNSWIAAGISVAGDGCDIIAYRVVQP